LEHNPRQNLESVTANSGQDLSMRRAEQRSEGEINANEIKDDETYARIGEGGPSKHSEDALVENSPRQPT
jgi:hypothetical protein